MNIWKLSIQNIKAKPLYTVLSIFSLSLSIGLLLGVQQLKVSYAYQMEHNLGGIDVVLGAKGSPLQLVLASVLHLDHPTGNISYKEAKKISENRLVKSAVPISYGDNYKGFRIVGTTPEFISLYKATLEVGNKITQPLEVLLGATVATQLQLHIGDTFLSAHGLVENDIEVHEEKFKVVGILKPTSKVIDRLIIANLESIWEIHNHEAHVGKHEKHEAHDDHHDAHAANHEKEDRHEKQEAHAEPQEYEKYVVSANEDKEITSLLIAFKSPMGLLTFPRKINKSTHMQAVLPKYELERLSEYTSIGLNTVTWIAYLILLISGMTIFISLYKMVKERAFDLALLRSYGASNFQLIKIVAYEALIIAAVAFVGAYMVVNVGLKYMLRFMASGQHEYLIQQLPLDKILTTGVAIFMMIALAVILAIYPIIRMNISTILSHEK